MAISPPSDIVLDVAQAAGPSAIEAARARLERTAGSGVGPSFDADGGKVARGIAARKVIPETFVKFEAMVLQTFLQSILPSDTEKVYGGGMAGEMWKSLLAERLGDVVAKRGGIGIAERVLGDHYLEGEKKVPVAGVSQGADKENADRQTLLSAALVHELQRTVVKTIGEEDHSSAAAEAGRRK